MQRAREPLDFLERVVVDHTHPDDSLVGGEAETLAIAAWTSGNINVSSDPADLDELLDGRELCVACDDCGVQPNRCGHRECIGIGQRIARLHAGGVEHVLVFVVDDLQRERIEIVQHSLGVVDGAVLGDDVVDLTYVDLIDEQGCARFDGLPQKVSDRLGPAFVV